jgi:(p)ppGpp synthase/HD superfamily hydrolase
VWSGWSSGRRSGACIGSSDSRSGRSASGRGCIARRLDERWSGNKSRAVRGRSGRRATIRAAFGFAAARHADQYREIDGAPSIVHPIEVGRLLRGDGQPDHVVAAGLLHDVLEKTATGAQELDSSSEPA